MKTIDIINRSAGSLKQSKGRTILTSLAIGVGAFTIALAMAAGAGGRDYVSTIANQAGDAQALSVYPKYEAKDTSAKPALEEYGAKKEESKGGSISGVNSLTDKDVKYLKGLDGVESVVPSYSIALDYITRGGVEDKKFLSGMQVRADKIDMGIKAGGLDKNNNIPAGSLVLPEEYLPQLGFSSAEDAVGKSIKVAYTDFKSIVDCIDYCGKTQEFKIAAVNGSGDTGLYYQPILWISDADGRAMYEYQNGSFENVEYYGATVIVGDVANVESVQGVVSERYEVYTFQQQKEALLQVISIAQYGLMGFGALAILASVFGVINTQYISVLERTQQIGLMKALGMRGRDIGRMFRYEAAWVGFLGGAIGSILAILLGLVANPIISDITKLESVSLLKFEPLSIALLILSLMFVAIASGYFPSRKAARLDPIEALRSE